MFDLLGPKKTQLFRPGAGPWRRRGARGAGGKAWRRPTKAAARGNGSLGEALYQ